MGPDKIKTLDIYLDTFNVLFLKEEISNRIKKDLLFFTKSLHKFDVKGFLKSSYLFRSGLCSLDEVATFGSALYNPIFNIDTELPLIILRYHESKIYKYTGLSLESFMKKTKEEQDTIFTTVISLDVIDKATMDSMVDELELEDIKE